MRDPVEYQFRTLLALAVAPLTDRDTYNARVFKVVVVFVGFNAIWHWSFVWPFFRCLHRFLSHRH